MMKAKKIIIAKGKDETLFLESVSSASYLISLANGAKAEIVVVNSAPTDVDVEMKVNVKIGKKPC